MPDVYMSNGNSNLGLYAYTGRTALAEASFWTRCQVSFVSSMYQTVFRGRLHLFSPFTVMVSLWYAQP